MKKYSTFIICMLALSLNLFAQPDYTGTWPNYQIGNSTFTIDCDGFVLFDLDPEVTRYKVFNSNDDVFGPEIIDLWQGNGTFPDFLYDQVNNSSDFGMDLITPEDNFFIEVYINNSSTSTVLPVSSLIAENCPNDSPDCGGTMLDIDCNAYPGEENPVGVTITFGDNPTRFKLWDFNDQSNPIYPITLSGPQIPGTFNTADEGIIIPCDGNIFIEVVYNDYQCTETFNISNLIDDQCTSCDDNAPPCGGTVLDIDCEAFPGEENPVGVTITFGNNPTRFKLWDFNDQSNPIYPITLDGPQIPSTFNTADEAIIIPCDGNIFIEVVYNNFQCTETFNISNLIDDQCTSCDDESDFREGDETESFISTYEMTVYPNPASGYINLTLPLIEGAYESQVFDLNGKLLTSNSFSSNATKIDLQNFQNGIYLLKVTGGEYNFMEKIQIVK